MEISGFFADVVSIPVVSFEGFLGQMKKAENDETNIGYKKNSEIENVFQGLLRSTRVRLLKDNPIRSGTVFKRI